MNVSIKSKALKSTIWSGVERFSIQGISFLVMIIMARILSPADYGLVGMLTIFIAISQALVDCGFSQALIRKQDRTELDNSTVFYFNIVVAFGIYLTLFFSAPFIANFYNEQALVLITRVVSLCVIINSFVVVQRALFTVNLDFKTQAKASFFASSVSGIIGILLAYNDFGVWSIIVYQLLNVLINALLLWILSQWRPKLIYSWQSFRLLFGFGSKLAFSSILSTIYDNLYLIVIGKIYRPTELGYYTRAYQFAIFPSTNITQITQRVNFPILCQNQDNNLKLIQLYIPFLKAVSFIVFPCMCGLIGISDILISVVLGRQWEDAAILLQVICLSLMWYPLQSMNNSILQVKGRSDLVLKVDIIKKVIGVACICIFASFGVVMLCVGNIVSTIFATIIHLYYTNRLVGLKGMLQLKVILFPLFSAAVTGLAAYLISHQFNNMILQLSFGLIGAIITFILMTAWSKSSPFKELIKMIKTDNHE